MCPLKKKRKELMADLGSYVLIFLMVTSSRSLDYRPEDGESENTRCDHSKETSLHGLWAPEVPVEKTVKTVSFKKMRSFLFSFMRSFIGELWAHSFFLFFNVSPISSPEDLK